MSFTEKQVASLKGPTDPDVAQVHHHDDDPVGFGVTVGRTGARVFFVRGRVEGTRKRVKVTIGTWRAPRPDGQPWTVLLARKRARELLGQMAAGVNPNDALGRSRKAPSKPTNTGRTLRDGVEAHLARMRKKNRAERSIQTFTHETTKYLAEWLDKPINDIDCVALHESIKRNAAKRKGSNPANDKGAPLANRVIAHVSASWRSLNKQLKGALGNWNPANAVDKDTIKPKRERVVDLHDWAARVATMRSPIRRDGLMLALYTGLRHEDVRSIRFEHVDFDEHTLHMPDPKGGPGAAFTIPLSKTPLEILKRRQRDNGRDLAATYGLDAAADHGGWAFPGIDLDGVPGPISNLRQKSSSKDERFPAEDVHTLRRTWESIAQEEGISELDQHVLSNHSFGSHNVNATYIAQHIDHLAACAATIDAGITRRLNTAPTGKRARRDALRSVA